MSVNIPKVPGLPQPGRTLVMGVVNVTPDSFSDGGEWFDADAAVSHGHALVAQGADLVDVGGESTRPGAERPSVAEELRRVLPVVRALAPTTCVSIDTMRAEVAAAAIGAGARLVNDVSGGQADPAMFRAVAEAAVPIVVMHWRGHSAQMQERAHYADVAAEVTAELRAQIDQALAAGIAPERLVLDPGIGFAKTGEHNWELLSRLDELDALGRPLLIGVSRKAFLGTLLPGADGRPRPARDRDDATTALTYALAARGTWGVRVHSVRPSRDAIAVAERLGRADVHPRSPRNHPADHNFARLPVGHWRGVADRIRSSPSGGTVAAPAPEHPSVAAAPEQLDRIALTGITGHGHHGVFAAEREQGQPFVVDVTCELDLSRAASSDDLDRTVDYGALAAAVVADIERDPLNLIEALAGRIADTCLDYPAVQRVVVTVHKPAAPVPVPVADVAVTLTRSR